MDAPGYEFYLRVLKVSLTSERNIDEMSRFKTTCFIRSPSPGACNLTILVQRRFHK